MLGGGTSVQYQLTGSRRESKNERDCSDVEKTAPETRTRKEKGTSTKKTKEETGGWVMMEDPNKTK